MTEGGAPARVLPDMLSLPNILTLSRIFAVPFLVWVLWPQPKWYDFAFAFNTAQATGDNTAFLDDVQITPQAMPPMSAVPEPATVALLGAGGMLAFEPTGEVEGGFTSYADALWWTAMLLTSMGSEFWPRTPEGRLLCLLLAVYGFAVFGYITASFASFFVGRDAGSTEGEVAGAADIAALHREVAAMRADIGRGRLSQSATGA